MWWQILIAFFIFWAGIEIGYHFSWIRDKDGDETEVMMVFSEEKKAVVPVTKKQIMDQYSTMIKDVKLLRYNLLHLAYEQGEKIELNPNTEYPPRPEVLEKVKECVPKPYLTPHRTLKYIWPDLVLYFAQAVDLPPNPWERHVALDIPEEGETVSFRIAYAEGKGLEIEMVERSQLEREEYKNGDKGGE